MTDVVIAGIRQTEVGEHWDIDLHEPIVALMDQICPPSTVFAAYNHWAGEKDIKVYPYNGHEGGQSFQNFEKLKFLKSIWQVI